MRFVMTAGLVLASCISLTGAGYGQSATNPEDAAIPDDATPTQKATPAPPPPTATTTTGDMIMVPRAVWEQLLKDVEELKRARGTTTAAPTPAPAAEPAPGTQPSGGSRNYLLLPDISFIMQAKGAVSSDRRDPDRRKMVLAEGELGIQGYLYPGVKADAFIVGAPAEDEPFQIEEGYLTFLGLRKGLNVNVGRKFVPFGRTGELHNHSWLYTRQIAPIRNLVASEALAGDGVNLNYLLPLRGKLFARASLGAFTGQGTDTRFNSANPNDPFFGGLPAGPGAGFGDRFYAGRLWLGHPVGENGELEVGASHARGDSVIADDTGASFAGKVKMLGLDASYRQFLPGGRRLLLRSEYFRHDPDGSLPTTRATGYYGLANYRFNKYNDLGFLYESSGFPQAPGARETGTSLIYTKQFTEQFYLRLQGTHGSRPGDGSYNELRVQLVGGVGPHTHNLE